MASTSAPTPTNKSRTWQVNAHQDWVKAVLIKLILKEKSSVCQLNCGDGIDLGKWDRAQVSSFLGVDDNAELLNKAKSRGLQKGCSFVSSQFLTVDIKKEPLEDFFLPRGGYDHVACFQGLDQIMSSVDSIQMVLHSVSYILKDGGYFFGIMMDSSAIWSSVQKSLLDSNSLPKSQSKLFVIQFQSANFEHTGCSYTYSMDQRTNLHYLIHLPTLIQFAKKQNLRVLSLVNCNEFYEDHKKHFGDLLNRAFQVNSSEKLTIDPEQKQIIGFYTTFVFQKV